MTHYIVKLTVADVHGRQRSACGTFVQAADHAFEPECPACQRYLNSGPAPETSVTVTKVTPLPAQYTTMDSIASFPNATADLFEPDVLTISSLTDGEVIETFAPDRWRYAAVIGTGGHYAFSFQNKRLQASDAAALGHVESRERRRSA